MSQLDLFGYDDYWQSMPDWWMCGERFIEHGSRWACGT